MSLLFGVLGIVVAALALSASMWSVVSARRMSRHQAELQERLGALETARDEEHVRQSQRASVRATIRKVGRDWRLIVLNEGPATAQDVKVELDGGPLFAHTLVPRGQGLVTTLRPGAYARYLLKPTMGRPMKVDACVTWNDASNQRRSWKSQLSMI